MRKPVSYHAIPVIVSEAECVKTDASNTIACPRIAQVLRTQRSLTWIIVIAFGAKTNTFKEAEDALKIDHITDHKHIDIHVDNFMTNKNTHNSYMHACIIIRPDNG